MSSYVTGALLMGQMAHEPSSLEGHILTLGWLFASFILAASFTAELTSFLSLDEQTVLVSHAAQRAHAHKLPKAFLPYVLYFG